MSERTPNTHTVRHGWIMGHPFPLSTDIDDRGAEFDRWLAAHDAEVRAASIAEASRVARTYDTGYDSTAVTISEGIADLAFVVPEEPEWEYECRVDATWDWRACTEDAALCPNGSERRCRRKAGPWLPVEGGE